MLMARRVGDAVVLAIGCEFLAAFGDEEEKFVFEIEMVGIVRTVFLRQIFLQLELLRFEIFVELFDDEVLFLILLLRFFEQLLRVVTVRIGFVGFFVRDLGI